MTKTSETKPTDTAKPLERYLQILEVIAAGDGDVTLIDLVNILMLPKTTVYRLLQGLLQVEAISAGGRGRNVTYWIAPRMMRILQLGMNDNRLELATKHHLQRLSSATGFTSYIARLGAKSVRSVAMRTPDAVSGIYVSPGVVLAPHATAAGKAIFAYQSSDFLAEALPRSLPRLTAQTITDPAELEAEFALVREMGYARCRAEDVEGFGALACPIELDSLGVSFSVGITGTVDQVFSAELDQNVDLLRAAAKDIEASLQSLPRSVTALPVEPA